VPRNVFRHRRWDPIRLVLLGGWLATLGVSPARGAEIPSLRSEQPPDFNADFALSLDSEGHPAMGVSIAIPYQGLQWVKLPPGGSRYGADLELSVAFEPPRPGPLYGAIWQRQVVVAGFEATRASRATVVERRTLDLPPGRYHVTVRVRDLDAQTESKAEQSVVVPDYSRVPVGFGDLELGVADSISGFHPVAAQVFGAEVRSLAARAALFDRRAGSWPRVYDFRYRILDEAGNSLADGKARATVSHSAEPLVLMAGGHDLFLGHYVLEVELIDGRSHWRVERSFDVEESGPPRGVDFERLLEPMAYIASGDEIQKLRDLPEGQRPQGWEDFWRRRDPTPDTPRNEALIEFVRRLRYAERHFQGFGPGWRSDMGRIYIRYGPPAQIENRPSTATSPQLEIWSYENPYRRFVFGDREGFGRYALLSPLGE
jgi:GWxTD domain-containing protein